MAPKRARAQAGSSPKRARVSSDPVKAKVNALAAAFDDDQQVGMVNIPTPCRTMLGAVLASALGPGAGVDERHKYQSGVTSAIGDVLGQVVAAWEAKLSEVSSVHAGAESETSQRAAVVSAAEADLKAKSDDADSKEAAFLDASQGLMVAESDVTDSQLEVDVCESQKDSKTGEKDKVTKLLNDHFLVLKTCNWTGPDEQAKSEAKLSKPLVTLLKKLKADGSLLTAMPSALSKTPEVRGTFDNMVVTQLEGLITAHIAELDAWLNNFESTLAEKNGVVEAKKSALEAATQKKASCDEALQAAKSAKSSSEEALKEAQAVLAEFTQKSNVHAATKDETEGLLATAKENFGAFEFLRDRVGAPPPEPEPVAAAEAAPEPAA